MIRFTKKNNKILNCTKQSLDTFIKASNILLEPFCEIKRGQDQKAQKQLKIPANSLPQGETFIKKKTLISLTEFCKRRNIPFNENEKRYYQMEKSKIQNRTFDQAVNACYDGVAKRHKLTTTSTSSNQKVVTSPIAQTSSAANTEL